MSKAGFLLPHFQSRSVAFSLLDAPHSLGRLRLALRPPAFFCALLMQTFLLPGSPSSDVCARSRSPKTASSFCWCRDRSLGALSVREPNQGASEGSSARHDGLGREPLPDDGAVRLPVRLRGHEGAPVQREDFGVLPSGRRV